MTKEFKKKEKKGKRKDNKKIQKKEKEKERRGRQRKISRKIIREAGRIKVKKNQSLIYNQHSQERRTANNNGKKYRRSIRASRIRKKRNRKIIRETGRIKVKKRKKKQGLIYNQHKQQRRTASSNANIKTKEYKNK